MAQRNYLKYLAVFAVAFALLLAAGPATSWAIPGDPDNDGIPTVDELVIGTDPLIADTDNDGLLDGAEVNILGTNPLLADTDANGTLDGYEDFDGDGFDNSVELASGSNPLLPNDSGHLKIITLTAPLPSAPDYLRNTTPVDTPITLFFLVAADADFVQYIVQFDADPTFASPVEISQTPAPSVTPGPNAWKKITHEDRVVYWRVLGVLDNGRRFSSEIASFEITKGPTAVGVLTGSQEMAASWDPAVIPTFTWTDTDHSLFRVFLTSREKLQSAVIDIPKDGTWVGFTDTGGGRTWTPGWRTWKQITQLGKNLMYRVAARGDAGHWAFSEWAELTLDGGATNGTATPPIVLAETRIGNDPDLIPTFSVDAGSAPVYRFFFSGTGDFTGAKIIAWPAASWTGTLSYTPTAAEWNAITALGPRIFWLVRGYNATSRVYTNSEIFSYEIGTDWLTVSGLSATGLNSVDSALPIFNFGTVLSAEAFTPEDYQMIFATDSQAAGEVVRNPAVPQVATSWTMPVAVSRAMAYLDTAFPWFIVQGWTTLGNSYFSPAYQLTASAFLRSPDLNSPGSAVEPSETYAISWNRSPDDNFADPQVDPRTVRCYELQEASNSSFTAGVTSFYKSDEISRSFTHPEVTEVTFFYYRVRAINSVGHSAWSNVGKKKINAIPWSAVYSTAQPCSDGGDNYIVDDKQNNSRGNMVHFGPGWQSRVEGGFGPSGYMGDYHYITSYGPGGPPNGNENATFTPNLAKAGTYEVFVGFFATFNRDNHVEFTVNSASGSTGPFAVSMWISTATGLEEWVSLGKFRFNAGTSGNVHHQFSAVGSSQSEEVDAVVFKYVGP